MVACRDLFKPDLALGDAWTREFSASPYKDISTEQELASEEWEQIRIQFHHKEFTIHDLEMATGKDWVRKLNQEKISKYAQYSWDDLLKQKGIGYKKAKSLLELLLIAGKLPNFR